MVKCTSEKVEINYSLAINDLIKKANYIPDSKDVFQFESLCSLINCSRVVCSCLRIPVHSYIEVSCQALISLGLNMESDGWSLTDK